MIWQVSIFAVILLYSIILIQDYRINTQTFQVLSQTFNNFILIKFINQIIGRVTRYHQLSDGDGGSPN